jgi:hypothetical protein
MGGELQGRALKEDDATLVKDNKLVRKSLRMTKAEAKKESLCPTKHQEMTTDDLKGNYQSNNFPCIVGYIYIIYKQKV